MIDLDYEKKYNKMISSINRVAGLFHFIEVHNIGTDYNSSIYYYEAKKLHLKNTCINDYQYIDTISFAQMILRAFGLQFKLKISQNNKLYSLISNYFDNNFLLIEEIESIEILANGNTIGYLSSNENKIEVIIDLSLLFNLILENGKRLNSNDALHVIFVTDKKYSKECYKALNVSRIGGLSCKMLYDDFTDSDIEPTKFLVEITNETMANKMVNIKDMINDTVESVNIFDIYPYIINKINKQSKCISCKEE